MKHQIFLPEIKIPASDESITDFVDEVYDTLEHEEQASRDEETSFAVQPLIFYTGETYNKKFAQQLANATGAVGIPLYDKPEFTDKGQLLPSNYESQVQKLLEKTNTVFYVLNSQALQAGLEHIAESKQIDVAQPSSAQAVMYTRAGNEFLF